MMHHVYSFLNQVECFLIYKGWVMSVYNGHDWPGRIALYSAPEFSEIGRIGQDIFYGPTLEEIAADGVNAQFIQSDCDLPAGFSV